MLIITIIIIILLLSILFPTVLELMYSKYSLKISMIHPFNF